MAAGGAADPAAAAQALGVSRQSPHRTPRTPRETDGKVVELRRLRPRLPKGWPTMVLTSDTVGRQTALHVLARRHRPAGCRTPFPRLWRWGLQKHRTVHHPKAHDRRFDITALNRL
jgi:hypothetical protein